MKAGAPLHGFGTRIAPPFSIMEKTAGTAPRFPMLRRACEHVYLARTEIAGFAILWPLAGVGLQTPLLRGLADINWAQAFMVGVLATAIALFLVLTTILTVVWGPMRMASNDVYPTPRMTPAAWPRAAVGVIGLACLSGFFFDVNARSDQGGLMSAFVAGAGVAVFLYVFYAWFVDPQWLAVVLAPRPTEVTRQGLSPWEWLPGIGAFVSLQRLLRRFQKEPGPEKTYPFATRPANLLLRVFNWLGISAGYCAYDTAGRPTRVLPGHLSAAVLVFIFLVIAEVTGFDWLTRTGSADDGTSSTLSMLLAGWLFVQCLISAFAFYADRYRVPVVGIVLALATLTSFTLGRETTFESEPVDPDRLAAAPVPAEVLKLSRGRFIVVAAAGGGIQASGWTTQILAGLSADSQTGRSFLENLRVISAVSGGSVGAIQYLAAYPDVWSKEAMAAPRTIENAMASSLMAATWGLVYPDLHQTLLPIHSWPHDRGWALGRSFAHTAGRFPGPKLLDLSNGIREGLPVVLLNATLSDQALPVVFSNAQFPDPKAPEDHKRSIRGFHTDFRLETTLETAARLSAAFPFVSPAARPSEMLSHDAFLDGGYFDNSGLYTLMAWLEQSADAQLDSDPPADVLLITIDAFPEVAARVQQRERMRWYSEFAIPLQTIVGVRETGQAARIRYELPLMTRNVERRMTIERVEFRYRPSPRCGLEPPPLSWHLTSKEKGCIREGWNERRVVESRTKVREWLEKSRGVATKAAMGNIPGSAPNGRALKPTAGEPNRQ